MGELLFFHFRVTNVKLIDEKNSLNIAAPMSANPWKLISLCRFLRTSYNSMYWGCPGILKSGSDMGGLQQTGIYQVFASGLHPSWCQRH